MSYVPNQILRRLGAVVIVSSMLLLYQNCSKGFNSSASIDGQALSSTGGEAPPPEPIGKMVDVFMGMGHMGRTLMSCDDGQTWINDMSANDAARCWVAQTDPNYVECDHTPYSGRGIDANDGWFFTVFGWGYNGSVKRSRDGKNWQVIRSDGWGGGLAYAKQRLFLVQGAFRTSENQGDEWNDVMNSPASTVGYPSVRRVGDTFFILGGRGSQNFLLRSGDQGLTWTVSTGIDKNWPRKIVSGNNRLVMLGNWWVQGQPTIGYSAVSTDDGRTWTVKQQPMNNLEWSELVFNGSQFVSWHGGNRYVSSDGLTWDATPINTNGSYNPQWWTGPVAFNSRTGTYVSILRSAFYDKQLAYRSSDGINWLPLPASAFKGGHPVNQIVSAQMDAAFCQ